jgi:hypothetical protein
MTAAESGEAPESSLARGASPATVRGHLPEPERTRFVTEYEAAIDLARSSLDLAPVLDVVERYRAIAIAHSDPEGFRRGVRRWAEILTGEPVPDGEPFEVTRARVGI